LVQPLSTVSSSPAPNKKFKSYTAQYNDEIDYSESNKNITSINHARRELETYLQMKLTKCTYMEDENDNPLLFWQENANISPNLSKLAKKIFNIPASSAGVIISQRRNSIHPSLVNDTILGRSAGSYLKS